LNRNHTQRGNSINGRSEAGGKRTAKKSLAKNGGMACHAAIFLPQIVLPFSFVAFEIGSPPLSVGSAMPTVREM